MKREIEMPVLTEEDRAWFESYYHSKSVSFSDFITEIADQNMSERDIKFYAKAWLLGYMLGEKQWNVILWQTNDLQDLCYIVLYKSNNGDVFTTEVYRARALQENSNYIFTTSELEQVKKDYPEFAKSIDLNKREVKPDED